MASITTIASANIGSAAILAMPSFSFPFLPSAAKLAEGKCRVRRGVARKPRGLNERTHLATHVMAAGLPPSLSNYFAHKVRKAPERPTKDADIWSRFIVFYITRGTDPTLIRNLNEHLDLIHLKNNYTLHSVEFYQQRTNQD